MIIMGWSMTMNLDFLNDCKGQSPPEVIGI